MAPTAEPSLSRPVRRSARKHAVQNSPAAQTPTSHTPRVSKRQASELHVRRRPVTRGYAPLQNSLSSAPVALETMASPLDLGGNSASHDSASPQTGPISTPKVLKRKASQLDLEGELTASDSQVRDHGPISAGLQLNARKSRAPARTDKSFLTSDRSLIATLRLSSASCAAFAAYCLNASVANVAQASTISGPVLSNGASKSLPATQVELREAPIAAAVPIKKRKTTRATPKSKPNFSTPAVDTRPLPWGDPQVWAETRTDLCETLPYFNQNQGATSYLNGVVRGMLQDHDGGERSLLEEELVITRCSGGLGTDDNGQTCQVSDHDANAASIACFSNNMRSKQPLMLILGSNNKQCPAKIPHRYCVMAPFHVTDVWDEKSYGKIAVKVRLEKTDLEHKSWWAAENSGSSPGTLEITKDKAPRATCLVCHQERPQIFAEGWICLNRHCSSFWILDGREIAHGLKLTYNPVFLAERTIFDGFLPPFLSVPKPIKATGQHDRLFSVTRQCWRGVVCTKCGRCNSRRDWDAWRCRSEGCDFEWRLPRDVIPASAVMGDLKFGFQGHAICDDEVLDSRIKITDERLGFWRVIRYEIMPGMVISHFCANDVINGKPGGADDIFGILQQGQLNLERQVMDSSVVLGQLTRHFSANIGLPYKYIVGQKESTSFSDAPAACTEAIRRMTWAAKHIVGDGLQEFNELLAVGYFQGTKMGYHDDGENTLGASVASWSLGGPSGFNFRVKDKFYSGFRSPGQKNYDWTYPILDLCYKPESRQAINQDAKGLSQTKLDKAAKNALTGIKRSPIFLKMKLRHGDFMVMHGAEMQKYTEHESVPTDMLRFALTARHVKPDMIDEDQHHKGVLNLDPMNPYDGDPELYEQYRREQAAVLAAAGARRRGAVDAAAT